MFCIYKLGEGIFSYHAKVSILAFFPNTTQFARNTLPFQQ